MQLPITRSEFNLLQGFGWSLRGLSGNRIQVNVNGVRFDDRQWQDEHGLGLSDMGVDRVEIIKGPSALFYGSDAMGGVLNIIKRGAGPLVSSKARYGFAFLLQHIGNFFQLRNQKIRRKKMVENGAGFDSHASYSDGNNNRVLKIHDLPVII